MFKLIKWVFYIALIYFIGCLVVGLFSDDETTEESEPQETTAVEGIKDKETALSIDEQVKNLEGGVNSSKKKSESATNSNWGTGKVMEISQKQFGSLVANYNTSKNRYIGNGTAVVDIYATWCGPCKMLSPIMDKMAKKYKGKVQFYKMDLEKANSVHSAYGIRSIPTLMFCKGTSIKIISGAPDEADLDALIAEML